MKLELGHKSDFELRRYRIEGPVRQPLRVMYLSDLHFGRRSGAMVERLTAAIAELSPDLLLLGGDYADSRAGLVHLEKLLRGLSLPHVLAVAGNHDRFFGLDRIRELMLRHGLQWIGEEAVCMEVKQTLLRIDGRKSAGKATGQKADLHLLCLHEPLDPAKLPGPYHLAFAGHLHGGQCVLWQNGKGLFPGRLFYRWNILDATIGNCRYFISKGLGDTLPLRYNCPKDLLVVDIEPSSKHIKT